MAARPPGAQPSTGSRALWPRVHTRTAELDLSTVAAILGLRFYGEFKPLNYFDFLRFSRVFLAKI